MYHGFHRQFMLHWRDHEIYEITVGFSPLALYLVIRHDSNAMRAHRVQPKIAGSLVGGFNPSEKY